MDNIRLCFFDTKGHEVGNAENAEIMGILVNDIELETFIEKGGSVDVWIDSCRMNDKPITSIREFREIFFGLEKINCRKGK